MEIRSKLGQEIVEKVAGSFGKEAIEKVGDFSPDFAKMLTDFAFGEIYSRDTLNLKQRELLTLSSLITQGANEDQLGFHFTAAIHTGFTIKELIEIIMHCAIYAGFPRALNALLILQKVCVDRNISVTD